MKDLYTNTPIYDVYMVGSDQVWNPNASSSAETLFLSIFAPHNALTISYTFKFWCVPKIEDNNIVNRIKDGLSSIKKISVREYSGVKLVSK